MFRKHKQLIVGILIGVFVTSAVVFADEIRTFVATEAQFPVLVDGAPVQLDMPVVVIEGRTYLPLRAMGDVLGVSVNWNDEKRQAEVYKEIIGGQGDENMLSKYIPPEELLNLEDAYAFKNDDNRYYIVIDYIGKKAEENNMTIKVERNNGSADGNFLYLYDEQQNLIKTIEYTYEPDAHGCVLYDYYVDEIEPLFKK